MIQRIDPYPTLPNGITLPLSKAVRAGDFLFLSGQLGLDSEGRLVEGGIKEQTTQVLKNVQEVLQKVGASNACIVKVTVWLTDPADFAGFNAVYGDMFSAVPPARSTVVSALVVPGARVEVEALAYLPTGKGV